MTWQDRLGPILILLLASAAVPTRPVYGQETTNAFLEIGVGPRALGMGGAFCGVADDGTAFYWNPAGMSLVERPRLSAMYGPQFGTIANPLGDYHFLGLALPMKGDVRIGVNWIRLSVDDIPVYQGLEGESYLERLRDRSLQPDGRPEGFLQDTEDAFFFSFSKLNANRLDLGWLYHRVRVDIPFGINIKWIRQSVGSYSATGLGVDIGTMMRFHLNDLFQSDKLGVVFDRSSPSGRDADHHAMEHPSSGRNAQELEVRNGLPVPASGPEYGCAPGL